MLSFTRLCCRTTWGAWRLQILLATLMLISTVAVGETIGSGDGSIHIIPTLSAKSVKNAETLALQGSTGRIAGNDAVGTTAYPDGGLRRVDAATDFEFREHDIASAVIDRANGYAYFATSTHPIRVVKVALGTGDEPPVRVGAVTLEPGESGLNHAVIDTANGYAYFAANGYNFFIDDPNTEPDRVVKVALGRGDEPPRRVGAVTLNPEERDIQSAVIDAANGYAYFGTDTRPGRVVKVALGQGDEPPTRVSTVTLEEAESNLRSAVIDPESGYAYFATWTSPGRVVKVALGEGNDPPLRVGAVTLNAGEIWLRSAVIDPESGYAYFGTKYAYHGGKTSPGRVVKVALGEGNDPPRRVDAVTLERGDRWFQIDESELWSAAIDPASGYAYFGTAAADGTGRVVKVALGEGDAPPSRVGAVTLEKGEALLSTAVIDPENGYAYFGTQTAPGGVVKVALGEGDAPPTRVDTATLTVGDEWLSNGVIDAANGYAYFTTGHRVVKVALGTGGVPPTRVGATALGGPLGTAVIDAANGYAYFASVAPNRAGRVVKVAPGEGDAPPRLVGEVTLERGTRWFTAEEGKPRTAVIDSANGYGYFGIEGEPGRVVKVALGEGDDPPSRVAAVTLEEGENNLSSAVIDAVNGYAYFGTSTDPGMVVKVALGQGDDPPSRVGVVTLEEGEKQLASAVIDPANGYAYFGTGAEPGIVVKVALGEGDAPPTRVGAAALEEADSFLFTAVIDAARGYAYFGAVSDFMRVVQAMHGIGSAPPGRVVKVALGEGCAPPTRVGAVTLADGEIMPRGAVMDPATGYAYFGTGAETSRVVRVALSHKGFIHGARLTMPEDGVLTEMRAYSHAASGNLRLGLYDDASNPALLWESAVIANTAEADWLNVPIGSGTPASLMLPAGTYWMAWQVDTPVDVFSYSPGNPGESFVVPRAFDAFPAKLESGTSTERVLTDDRWSVYVVYELAE